MPQLPTGTVTLVFTAIDNPAALVDEHGREGVDELLQEHRRILREAFAANSGVELRTEGDSFFAAFGGAQDAVAAAAQARAGLVAAGIPVSIGIHTGEPRRVEHEDGYVGIDVHRAARIAAAASPGQVLVSQATRDLLDRSVELRDLGSHRLKDLAGPERLYQLGGGEAAPVRSLSQAQLPAQPTRFVGRRRELDELLGLLREERVRLVTLTGAGGSGKTRLALEAAAALVPELPDGVCFVPLATVREGTMLLPTIAQALDVREPQTVEEYLLSRRPLLVLDNFEQLLDAAPAVGSLLASSPELRLLVTSRAPLRIAGEREVPVPPLADPDAVELFVERARAVMPSFRGDEAVGDICARLDNLPLALELAAARVKLLSPERLAARLERQLELLTGGPRDSPSRQQTLRAAIAWSHDLLAEPERRLLARLGVFVGGFAVEAAESICEATIDDITALVENSLLWRSGEDRIAMLAVIREFALERLEEDKAADEVRRRHAEWFAAVAAEAEQQLTTAQQADCLERLEIEHDNLRAALDFALARGERELALRLTAPLWRFWLLRGHLREGRAWFERALVGDGQPSRLRADALRGAAALASSQGDFEFARAQCEECVALYRELGDDRGLARALNNLANTLSAGHVSAEGEAAPLYRESIRLLRGLGDDWGVAVATLNLGNLALAEEDYPEAASRCEESLERFRRLGDTEGIVHSLNTLGFAALCLGRREEATQRLCEALALAQVLGDVADLADALEGVAGVSAAEDDWARAAELLGAAAHLREPAGAVREVAYDATVERTLAAVRQALAPERLERALAEGRALSLEAAVEAATAAAPGAVS